MVSAAARMRALRDRQRAGRCVVPVEIQHEKVTSALVALDILDELAVDNKTAVGEAVGTIFRAGLEAEMKRRFGVTRN